MNKTKLRIIPRPKFSGEQLERLAELIDGAIHATTQEIDKTLGFKEFSQKEKQEWVKHDKEAVEKDKKLLAKLGEVARWKI